MPARIYRSNLAVVEKRCQRNRSYELGGKGASQRILFGGSTHDWAKATGVPSQDIPTFVHLFAASVEEAFGAVEASNTFAQATKECQAVATIRGRRHESASARSMVLPDKESDTAAVLVQALLEEGDAVLGIVHDAVITSSMTESELDGIRERAKLLTEVRYVSRDPSEMHRTSVG